MEDSPVEITEQKAIDTVEELWSRLFSMETQIDTDDFYTDRGMKRTSEDPNDGIPAKSNRNGSAGNSDPLPLGYSRGTCDECVEIVFKIGQKHSKQKKTVNHNWDLLLYMKKTDPEEVRNIENKVIEYLNESATGSTNRMQIICFVCNRQARGNNHNIKDCIQIVDVSLRANGQMRYVKGMGRPLNTCMRGSHAHHTYANQLERATNGDGGFAVVEKFMELEGQGATPCLRCGDVFPTHQPEHCPNYPYLTVGDQGFKAAYDAQILAILE